MTTPAPKRVFVSHASENKLAYAKPMADHLITQKGIDAWLDLYEMVGGDDLVKKIWEHGFESDCIIILLSPDFLKKEWPMSELRTAIAKKINDKQRVIPVIVEACDVPNALASTLRFEVGKDGTIIEIADKIADIVRAVPIKPALGTAAGYLTAITVSIPGLNPKDIFVLEAIHQQVLSAGHNRVEVDPILAIATSNGISEADLSDCLEILEGDYWITDAAHVIGRRLPIMVKLSGRSVLTLAKGNGSDIAALQCHVAGLILNDNILDGRQLEARATCPLAVLEAILDDFQSQGLLDRRIMMGGFHQVFNVGAKLRRWFATEC